jgi:hypothetical protein
VRCSDRCNVNVGSVDSKQRSSMSSGLTKDSTRPDDNVTGKIRRVRRYPWDRQIRSVELASAGFLCHCCIEDLQEERSSKQACHPVSLRHMPRPVDKSSIEEGAGCGTCRSCHRRGVSMGSSDLCKLLLLLRTCRLTKEVAAARNVRHPVRTDLWPDRMTHHRMTGAAPSLLLAELSSTLARRRILRELLHSERHVLATQWRTLLVNTMMLVIRSDEEH